MSGPEYETVNNVAIEYQSSQSKVDPSSSDGADKSENSNVRELCWVNISIWAHYYIILFILLFTLLL